MYQNIKDDVMSDNAVAVLAPNNNGVSGVVYFIQDGNTLHIDYSISGMSDGEHGFHIHEYGDLTDGCESACSHFNPDGKEHGGLDSEIRHLGDLGNITSMRGIAKGRLSTDTISLKMNKKNCIVGRMIIVHQDRDDLGLGGNAESLKTGNAGKRLGCGVIGLQEPPKNDSDVDVKPMDADEITTNNTLVKDLTIIFIGCIVGGVGASLIHSKISNK